MTAFRVQEGAAVRGRDHGPMVVQDAAAEVSASVLKGNLKGHICSGLLGVFTPFKDKFGFSHIALL